MWCILEYDVNMRSAMYMCMRIVCTGQTHTVHLYKNHVYILYEPNEMRKICVYICWVIQLSIVRISLGWISAYWLNTHKKMNNLMIFSLILVQTHTLTQTRACKIKLNNDDSGSYILIYKIEVVQFSFLFYFWFDDEIQLWFCPDHLTL